MARQFEWEHSNLQISYPFEQNVDPDIQRLFADALILDTSGKQERVKLQTLTITSVEPAVATVAVDYVDDSGFWQGPIDLEMFEFGQWLVVKAQTELFALRSVTLMLNKDEITSYPFTVIPIPAAVFVTRVTEKTARRVRKITVQDSVTEIIHEIEEPCKFVAGYNLDIPQVTTNPLVARPGTNLQFNVVPGAGLGLVPNDCDHDDVLRTINGVGPDENGNVLLSPTGCYRYVLPYVSYTATTIVISASVIQMFNDCYPCCECEDYGNVYTAMDRLYQRGRNIGLRLANVIGTLSPGQGVPGTGYKGLREEMEDERQARRIPRMNIFLRPSPGYILGVELIFKNNRPGEPINMGNTESEEALVTFSMENDEEEGRAGFNAKTGELIPDSIYVMNTSKGTSWEHRKVSEVFPDYAENFTEDQGLVLTYTPEPTEEEPEPEPEPEIIDGTQCLYVFFEVYFGNGDVEDKDIAGAGLESDAFLPVDKLIKFETLVPPFDGTIEAEE